MVIVTASIPGAIAKGLNISIPLVLAVTMSTFNLFLAAGATMGGPHIDKLGVNKIYITCLSMVILGDLLIYFFGTNVIILFLARLLQGLGTGPIMAAISLLAARWFKPNEQGIVTGLQGVAVSLGITIGFILIPFLLEITNSWRIVFALLSIANALGIIMTFIVMAGPAPRPQRVFQQKETTKAEFLKFKLWHPLIIVCALSLFLGTWLQQGVNTIGAIFLGTEIGLEDAKGSVFMSYYSTAYMIGS